MKKVIVTGANGFLGKYLVDELYQSGYEIFAIVRNKFAETSEIEKKVSKFIYCEMSDYCKLPELIKDKEFDCCYNLAWSGSSGNNRADYRMQLGNSKNCADLVEAVARIGCKRFVGIGSVTEFTCNEYMRIDGSVPELVVSYAIGKIAANYLCKTLCAKYNIDFLWAYLSNFYGIGDKSNNIIKYIISCYLRNEEPILTSGLQKVDFIHVKDVAKAVVSVGEKGKKNCSYYVGYCEPKPLKEFVEEIYKEIKPTIGNGLGRRSYLSKEINYESLDIKKLENDTGFKATLDFKTGISELIASFYKPLISVIVPIYGIERYLGFCVESLIKQTYQNLEIILVDDGSKDSCSKICDIYAQKDSRIKVIHKNNGGLVSARKAGLEIAKGEYVGYVDGDDWVEEDFFESLVEEAGKNKADIITAGRSRDLFNKSECFKDNLAVGFYSGDSLEQIKNSLISCGAFYKPGISTYVWNKLFKREFIKKYQDAVDNRISIGEDGAVTFSALMNCESLSIINNCSYHYRQREDSMLKKSGSYEHEALQLKLLHQHLSECAIKLPDKYNYQQQIDDYILSIYIIRSGSVAIDNDGNKLTAFNADFENKNIVIYSGGTFGQQLINRFAENTHCNIVGVVDDDYWEYRRCGIDVDPVEQITDFDYDYILIASVDSDISNSVRSRLLNLGVESNKILRVDLPAEKRRKMLNLYLEQSVIN